MTYIKVGYSESSVTDKKYVLSIKVSRIGKTNIFVADKDVNKPTMKEALSQAYSNRVYLIEDLKKGAKVIVGNLKYPSTFKKSIMHD